MLLAGMEAPSRTKRGRLLKLWVVFSFSAIVQTKPQQAQTCSHQETFLDIFICHWMFWCFPNEWAEISRLCLAKIPHQWEHQTEKLHSCSSDDLHFGGPCRLSSQMQNPGRCFPSLCSVISRLWLLLVVCLFFQIFQEGHRKEHCPTRRRISV